MKTLLLFIAFLLIASTIKAEEQPFAPKARKYNHNAYKKYDKKKTKNAFSYTKNRRINRKGLRK